MPHAALWVVQPRGGIWLCLLTSGFNAARGYSLSPPPPLRGPPPPLAQGRLFSYGMSASLPDTQDLAAAKSRRSVNGLLYFSFPRRCGGSGERSEPMGALMPHAAIPFRPHHRFAVPLPRSRRGGLVTRRFLVESRNISFPRRCGGSGERSEPIGALMPHAALWMVQLFSLVKM